MSTRSIVLGLFALGAALAPRTALAVDPACNTLTPTPLYLSGSTALEPLLKTIGPKVAADATSPYTLVYLKDGSCSGVTRIIGDGLIKQTMNYIPATYDGVSAVPTCSVDATAGLAGDLVLSDVDASLCPGSPAIPNLKDFNGPVNNMVFVVPNTSTQTAISAEQAYLVFGLADAGMVAPWLDKMYYFIRAVDSGTRAMITANIGTGSHAWNGVSMKPTGGSNGTGDVLNYVVGQATTGNQEKTIGILGEDFYDQSNNRSSVKALAYRAFKQRYAYWPDSTLTSRDKRNVRDGRYGIWGYIHMLAAVDGQGVPTNAKAKFFIDLLQGTSTPVGYDVTDAITDSHLTPTCAMNVKHPIEFGALTPYAPDKPCGCSFEKRATGAEPTGCMACTGTCPGTQVCRKNYCEAK